MGPTLKYLTPGSTLRLICKVLQSTEATAFIFWYHDNRMINYDLDRGINVTSEAGNDIFFNLPNLMEFELNVQLFKFCSQIFATQSYPLCMQRNKIQEIILAFHQTLNQLLSWYTFSKVFVFPFPQNNIARC